MQELRHTHEVERENAKYFELKILISCSISPTQVSKFSYRHLFGEALRIKTVLLQFYQVLTSQKCYMAVRLHTFVPLPSIMTASGTWNMHSLSLKDEMR